MRLGVTMAVLMIAQTAKFLANAPNRRPFHAPTARGCLLDEVENAEENLFHVKHVGQSNGEFRSLQSIQRTNVSRETAI